jgi:hypothetical protein
MSYASVGPVAYVFSFLYGKLNILGNILGKHTQKKKMDWSLTYAETYSNEYVFEKKTYSVGGCIFSRMSRMLNETDDDHHLIFFLIFFFCDEAHEGDEKPTTYSRRILVDFCVCWRLKHTQKRRVCLSQHTRLFFRNLARMSSTSMLV